MHCLPIYCFYDVCRILSSYIYKTDLYDNLGVAILDIPKELVELSLPIKLFHTDGRYLKVLVMSTHS
jgi:hypothetical protein